MGLSGKATTPDLISPNIGDLTSQAVNANISAIPRLVEAYRKYGPEVASALFEATANLNPTLKPLASLLTGRINEVMSGGIPDTLRRAYEVNFRNSSAARGFVDSPASANAESIGLAGLGEDYARNTISGAINFQNSLPDTPYLADLGLDLPSVDSQVKDALSAIKISNENAATKAAAKVKNNQNLLGGIGGLAGYYFGAGNPVASKVGYTVGQSLGTLF